jgi:hypothetical protein
VRVFFVSFQFLLLHPLTNLFIYQKNGRRRPKTSENQDGGFEKVFIGRMSLTNIHPQHPNQDMHTNGLLGLGLSPILINLSQERKRYYIL